MRFKRLASLVLIAGAIAQPVWAKSPLETGLIGALKGCEEWVMNPASWVETPEPFLSSTELGNMIGRVDRVEAMNLPPAQLRTANHYWRINSTPDAGYILVTSDQLPMCHITGGGNADLQPVVEAVLNGPEFLARWEKLDSQSGNEMQTTRFKFREDARFTLVVSWARLPGQRRDRVQVIATATHGLNE